MKKSKLLFILHLPDPVHGASVVGKFIKESKLINNTFDGDYINLSTSTSLNQAGKPGVRKIVNLLKIQFRVFKALLTNKFDLCYVTLTAKAPGFHKDIFVVIILKLFRQKIIYHFHNKGVSVRQINKLDNLLYQFTFSNTKTILLSPFLYYDVKNYVKRKDVFFCPNGIPKIPALSIKIKAVSYQPPYRLLFLSNMMVEKGVYVLLSACELLKNKGLDFECHFVGAWHNVSEDEFARRVQVANLARHVFAHGKKYGDEKVNFFNNADIFVFPTFYHDECLPLVLLEAMQFCLPIITTNEGGIPDAVIDGETGFLVPQQNVVKLAEKIEVLIEQPELRIKMGIEGKKRFLNLFTIEKFEARLAGILKEVIED